MLDSLAADMEGMTRPLLLETIAASKICVRLSTRGEGIQEGKVLLRKDKREELLKAETIALQVVQRAYPNSLGESVKSALRLTEFNVLTFSYSFLGLSLYCLFCPTPLRGSDNPDFLRSSDRQPLHKLSTAR